MTAALFSRRVAACRTCDGSGVDDRTSNLRPTTASVEFNVAALTLFALGGWYYPVAALDPRCAECGGEGYREVPS